MKKNEIVVGVCEDYTNEGLGVAKVDGFPLFVKGLLRGERARLLVMKVKKGYGFAKIVELLEESGERQKPFCKIYQWCGGCQLQHMSLKEQAYFKQQKVAHALRRIGNCEAKVEPILAMDAPYGYRNKGQIPVGVDAYGEVVCGFYRMNSHDIIDMEVCPIQSDLINTCVAVMKEGLRRFGCAAYFRHLLVKHAFANDTVMLVWIVRERVFSQMQELCDWVVGKLPMVKSIVLNVNQRKDNVILGEEEFLLYGEQMIYDTLGGIEFGISAKSFYQVNPVQTKVLYEQALAFAQLSGSEEVLDLYCGVGTISLFLAQHAKHVTGIEIVGDAIRNAKENARRNGIDHVDFICSDAAQYAAVLAERGKKVDVVVVDPPRKGCDELTLASILQMEPKRIVYVSCDPATLARDVRYLEERGYECVRVQPVDMFGWSYHVETVVLLSHKKADSYIHIDVEFGEGEGKIPVDSIAKRAEAYKPKEKVTYKMIKEYIEAKYGFKVHTAYIAEVKRNLGLPMYDAPNAVEELKQPRKHPTPEKVEAIKDALRYFAVI